MCPSCGICFSSASTLSAHATYYCSKRPQVTPAVAPVPVTNESPLPTQPEMMANVPLSNGRSQTPEQMDEMVCTQQHFKISYLKKIDAHF
jgi:hypothetical protein